MDRTVWSLALLQPTYSISPVIRLLCCWIFTSKPTVLYQIICFWNWQQLSHTVSKNRVNYYSWDSQLDVFSLCLNRNTPTYNFFSYGTLQNYSHPSNIFTFYHITVTKVIVRYNELNAKINTKKNKTGKRNWTMRILDIYFTLLLGNMNTKVHWAYIISPLSY